MTTNKTRAIPVREHHAFDAAQFDAVFIEHWQSIYRMLVRLVGDPAEAEDLSLDTFWRLYQHLPDITGESNIGGWLHRVATNLGLNALRARKRRMQHEMNPVQWTNETSASDPGQVVVAEEEREQVRKILAEMDERNAQLLILRHSGFKYAELADALHVTPSSVGTLLARAEREFEKRFRQKGE